MKVGITALFGYYIKCVRGSLTWSLIPTCASNLAGGERFFTQDSRNPRRRSWARRQAGAPANSLFP